MTWLDNNTKITTDVDHSVPTIADKYFELDDDTTGIDIDGYLFFPKQVEGSESFSHREFVRTKIMSGGEFVTRGQYIPKEFSFDTIIDIDPSHLDDYLNIFSLMENKICRVTSPYLGGMFNAEVIVEVTNPESSPHVIECKVTIKEIPKAMARLKGDPVIKYPSINTISDVNVKERKTNDKKEVKKRKELYDDYTPGSHSNLPGTSG